MAITRVSSASGTAVSSGNPSVTLPPTPQAGDWYTVIALAVSVGTVTSHGFTPPSGWTLQSSTANTQGVAYVYTRAWQSGDPNTFTPTWFNNGAKKWAKIYATLWRPGSGEQLELVAANTQQGSSSAATNTLSLTGGAVGDGVMSAILNDDKQTAFTHRTAPLSMGETDESSPGSGAPSNWSSFGSAFHVPTSWNSPPNVYVDLDDTGARYAQAAIALRSASTGTNVTVSGTSAGVGFAGAANTVSAIANVSLPLPSDWVVVPTACRQQPLSTSPSLQHPVVSG